MLCFAASAEIKPGDPPPDTLGTTQAGQAVSVPVLANLQTLATERGLPLQVVSINSRESRETFVRSSRALRRSLPGLLITWDRDGALGKPYGADKGIPVMVMLHRDGTVAHVHVGYGEDMLDSLVAEINALLAESAPAPAPVAAH
jgi:hypothetical protein